MFYTLFFLFNYFLFAYTTPLLQELVLDQESDVLLIQSDQERQDLDLLQSDLNQTAVDFPFLLSPPPLNKNWAQKDLSSKIRLGYGAFQDSHAVKAGATFRGSYDMGAYDGSCQYWRHGLLNFVNPGFNPYLVGAGTYFFGNSLNCGQCLLITNPANGKSIVSIITDLCPPPGCGSKQLDIQVAGSAFLASGNPFNSVPYKGGPMNYNGLYVREVECDWGNQNLGYYFDTGSSKFHWYLIIYFQNIVITSIEVGKLNGSGQVVYAANVKGHDNYGRWVVEFGGNGGEGIYKLTLTGKSGITIVDYIKWNGLAQTRVTGRTNFPVSKTSTMVPNWPEP